MAETLRWGILSTGHIAAAFAHGLAHAASGTLVAVGSRSQAAADEFGERFGVPRRYGSYETLLADPEVDAVYIAPPHPMHAEWAINALEAGKHVLCEKPIGMNHAEAMAIVETARARDRFLMEAFMYRCHPQTARLVDLIRAGAIGAVRAIDAAFAYDRAFAPDARQYDPALGGGGILDVGCYPVSLARLIAGAARGEPCAEPIDVQGVGHLGTTGVDEWASAVLRFPGDLIAHCFTGVHVRAENIARIYGSEGQITVPFPWKPWAEGNGGEIIVARAGAAPETIAIDDRRELYSIEADTVARDIPVRQSPAMPWDDTLGNMQTLDRWREAIGLTYPSEKPEAVTFTVSRRPLRKADDAPMIYGTLPGIAKPASRLVIGVDNQRTMPHLAVLLDDYFERGGTVFDTAWIYGGGECEQLLGWWVRNRGVRESVIIITKGAHTPFNTPDAVHRQLPESLDRLQMDAVDLYLLHRDNPAIPAGSFIDALNEHLRAGRIRAIGASNWTIPRVEEANAYAAAHGLQGFAVMSNNFSLARMVEPVWAGSLSASDATSREWLTRTQMPLLPWSSQARGFFTARAAPDDFSDPMLARSWYSEDNWERRRRAVQLAEERGVLPINIALAYVLNQPFPTFPLIGPRALAETRTSLPALAITLSPGEMRWLNLETDRREE